MTLRNAQFRNGDLWDLYQHGAPRHQNGIPQGLQRKCVRLLDQIEAATKPDDLNLPAYGFSQTGGTYSVSVARPNLISFRWSGHEPEQIDYV